MSDLTALNLEPGEVVGGYTLISRLGSGAMGSVWRVRDDGGQVYAMKILRDSLADDASGASGGAGAPDSRRPAQDPNLKENVTPRERLRREALALRKVNHPGVCGIVDMELDDALAFIVTELIEGRNLKDDVAANGRYVGDDLERLARKLIEAVRAVHAAGIIHRDIKPTNVMVSASGPVLVDFGIAMGEGESHVTRTGLVMGTPGFIAPEIIDGAESSEATDWWSVASVLAFAAMGEPVFGTKPLMAVLEREASGNANLAGLPAHTLAAFRSALHPDPTKRCTPDQLLHAIALDALTPFTGDFDDTPAVGLAKHADATGVMHPFDAALDGGADGKTVSLTAADPTDATSVLPDLPSGTAALESTSVLPPVKPVASARDAWRDGDVSGATDATRALRPDQCTVTLPSDLLDAADATAILDADDHPGSTAVMPARTRVMPLDSVPAARTSGETRDLWFDDARSDDDRFDDDAVDDPDGDSADVETSDDASAASNAAASPLRRLADASNGEGIGFTDMPPAYVPYRPPRDADAKPAADADGSPATAAIAPRANTVGSRPSGSNAESMGIGRPHTGVGAGDAMAAPVPATGGTVPEFLRDGQRQRMPQPSQATRTAQPAQPAPAWAPSSRTDGPRTSVMPPTPGAPGMAAGNAPASGVYGQPIRQPWPGQPPAGQRFPGQPYGMQPVSRPMAASPATMAMRQPLPGPTPSTTRMAGAGIPGTGMPAQPQQSQSPRNPAVETRARYLDRGRAPLSSLTVVPAVAAMLAPTAGPIAAAVIFWVLLTVGCSTDAQLLREERRGGERKSSDTALRAVQLPWHMLKALGMTAARMLLFLLIDVAGMTALTVTLSLPVTTVPTPNGLWPYQIPWPADGLLSPTGAALALTAGGAWLVTAFWPFAVTLRLGAGATRGNPPMA